MSEFVCQSCEKIFQSKKACKNRVPKYCSSICFGKSKIKWSICLNCGKQYTRFHDGNRNKYFCSMECTGAYKKGKPLSESHCKALSEAKIGKEIPYLHTPEVIEKIRQSLIGKPQPWMRGEKHPRYKNGGINFYERIQAMGRVEYKNWRRSVFSIDNYLCLKCATKGAKINAHHIKSWEDYPESRYDINNGITLCVKCHREIHRGPRIPILLESDHAPDTRDPQA